jgi:hypothetical protein
MTPERRDRVLRTARALGMRPFDANVIIAIAQDHARRGEPIAGAMPMLAMIPAPERRPASSSIWMRWVAAIVTAVVVAVLMARWIVG